MKADLFALGAPKLPSGHFYRVKYANFLGLSKVEIRRRGRFFTSFVEGVTFFPSEWGDTPEEALVAACKRAVENVEQRKGWARVSQGVDAYAGDHPGGADD